jgi:LPXTG-motif cell wall-anchored protein
LSDVRTISRFGAVVAVVFGATFGALAVTAASAAAVDAAACHFSFTTNAGAGTVHITGTAPPNAFVRAFVNGSATPAATTQADPGTGTFMMTVTASIPPDSIAVTAATNAQTAYPVSSCEHDPVQVAGESVQVAGASLAFTGSSGTPTLALVGIAAVLVGLVLVLGFRSRRARAG